MAAWLISIPPQAIPCPFIEAEASETIAVTTTNGKPVMVEVRRFAGEDDDSRCVAWVEVPLSSAPSIGLALRPADVARSMRDVVAKMGSEECTVRVMYENDTRDDLADHELCVVETFRFSQRSHWSTERESFCWTPEEMTETEVAEVE